MKIHSRIKKGQLKGWTIRQSKYGWYDLYSSGGASQMGRKSTLEEVTEKIKAITFSLKEKL